MIETAAARAAREKAEAPIRAARAAAHAEKMGTPPPPAQQPKVVTGSPAKDIIERIIADPNGKFTALTAKTLTKRIKDSHENTIRLLVVAHDREAWKALGFETWSAYVAANFDFSGRRGYQLLDHSRAVSEIAEKVNNCSLIPSVEGQTRPLKGLPAQQKAEAWTEATKAAGGKAPTGKQVAAAVEQMKPAKATVVATQDALPIITGTSTAPASIAAIEPAKPDKPTIEHDITTETRSFEARYTELLQAVESVFPGETRHQTALRYIREAEAEAQILSSRTSQP